MLHSIEVFLPVVKVVLKRPVTVVTEVSFPHLSSGRADQRGLGTIIQILGAQPCLPWGWRIQDLQRLNSFVSVGNGNSLSVFLSTFNLYFRIRHFSGAENHEGCSREALLSELPIVWPGSPLELRRGRTELV